jgi:hypothetical protein
MFAVDMSKKEVPRGLKLIQQGMERGIPIGQRLMLLHQLENRFGDQVDQKIRRSVMDAAPEQLARWADLVLSAGTLVEVLGAEP